MNIYLCLCQFIEKNMGSGANSTTQTFPVSSEKATIMTTRLMKLLCDNELIIYKEKDSSLALNTECWTLRVLKAVTALMENAAFNERAKGEILSIFSLFSFGNQNSAKLSSPQNFPSLPENQTFNTNKFEL